MSARPRYPCDRRSNNGSCGPAPAPTFGRVFAAGQRGAAFFRAREEVSGTARVTRFFRRVIGGRSVATPSGRRRGRRRSGAATISGDRSFGVTVGG